MSCFRDQKMDIISYSHFGTVLFGMDEKQVNQIYGKPNNIRSNNESELEYHYDGFIVRYSSDDVTVREFTLFPKLKGSFKLNELKLNWEDDLLTILCQLDGGPQEFYGYIVLFKLGITLTGYHDEDVSKKAISVFKQAGIGISSKMI